MAEGLVSTIVPVHNRPGMLVEAVESVLAQTYGHFEIIIVDDESTDSTPEVIAALERRDARIRSIRRPNGGPGAARETGRQAARGEFMQYLDSDDVLLPRKFELQVGALRDEPACALAYGPTRYTDANGAGIECTWKNARQVQRFIFPSFLVARWWETVTPLYRKAACDAAGPWTSMRLEEDWEYDCRVGSLGLPLAYVPHDVAIHRDHAEARLSRGVGLDPARLRDRARAHELIAGHARRAGITNEAPEMQIFARELFHVARQCGAAGLASESRKLVGLAREISPARDLRAYSAIARIIGWTNTARLAMWAERLR